MKTSGTTSMSCVLKDNRAVFNEIVKPEQTQSSEPIKNSQQIQVADAKRGKTCASGSRVISVSLLIG